MKLRKIKKYLGLCQCKGCLDWYCTIVACKNSDNVFYPAYLCEYHALEAIKDPFIIIGRF